jgi:aspartate aminotransferase-like enzyme
VRPGTHVLNLASGVFGKGMNYWLTAFGARLHEIETSWPTSAGPCAPETE